MNTNYQMYITYNAESEKMRIPVLPEKFTVSIGSKNTTVDVTGLGEITIKQSRRAYEFSFESFFPATPFPGANRLPINKPLAYVNKIKEWLEGKKPVHLIITDVGVDVYCTIEKFSYYEKGGDVGTIYYSMTFKEYREVTIRNVRIESSTQEAVVEKTETRVDNTVPPKTYTVKSGDCLWNIAKAFYGNGALYTKIYNANKGVIGSNPNIIRPGMVLTIPE